jgi:tetratricopeptide (TPR) repeat protein
MVAMSIKASPEGLRIIELAIMRISVTTRWAKSDERWAEEASKFLPKSSTSKGEIDSSVSSSTWKRFLGGESVNVANFIAFCSVLEINWKEVADLTANLQKKINLPAKTITVAMPEKVEPNKQKAINVKFVGREQAIADIDSFAKQGAKIIVIQGKGGVGKTTLARNYFLQRFGYYLEFPVAKETKDITPIESLLEERLRQLDIEPGRDFGISLERLRHRLKSQRIGILIDNLETALDECGRLIPLHRNYVELLRVLSDISFDSLTLITTRDRLHETDVPSWHYLLNGLSVEAWEEYFLSRVLERNSQALTAVHNAYGGNAKAMEIIAGATLVDFDGNLEKYWELNRKDLLVETDLRDLVAYQVNRLEKSHYPAFKLLRRLACYRYQDVPKVPTAGLTAMLWDEPEGQHLRIINALKDRGLVECQSGQYWLHPVIREDVIVRLRTSEDWTLANCKAGEFWTNSIERIVSIEEALQAFEAYYHHIAVGDFEEAAVVLLRTRKTEFDWHNKVGGETLGHSLRRLGASKRILIGVQEIVGNVSRSLNLGQIHINLAHNYWILGNLKESIVEYENAESIAIECLQKESESQNTLIANRLYMGALIGKGLSQIDLLDLEEAEAVFLKLLDVAKNEDFYSVTIECHYALAYIYSSLDHSDKALISIGKSYGSKDSTELSEWAVGHRFIFIGLTYKNLSETKKAYELYIEALSFAEENNYAQIKARALNGLAEIHRIEGDFDKSLSYHSKTIEILDKVDAKFDLAEAHYQLALTLQKIEDKAKSEENFVKAANLFKEINAVKQIKKIELARSIIAD